MGASVASASNLTTNEMSGEIMSIFYQEGTASYPATADFTITDTRTGQSLWTESNVSGDTVMYPRVALQDNTNSAVTYDGTRPIYDTIPVHGKITIALAQVSVGKTGKFFFYLRK